jgi:hypothetical protein
MALAAILVHVVGDMFATSRIVLVFHGVRKHMLIRFLGSHDDIVRLFQCFSSVSDCFKSTLATISSITSPMVKRPDTLPRGPWRDVC